MRRACDDLGFGDGADRTFGESALFDLQACAILTDRTLDMGIDRHARERSTMEMPMNVPDSKFASPMNRRNALNHC